MKIALVSEGSYPYAMGGVGVWCDQLISGLADHRWEVVTLVVDGTEKPLFRCPPNVEQLRPVPLWQQAPAGNRRSPQGEAGAAFWSAYETMLSALLGQSPPGSDEAVADGRRFVLALHGMFEYASGGGDLFSALTSNRALALLVEAWNSSRSTLHDGTLTLAGAIEATWVIEHLLRPLATEPVRADIVHASMNGPSMLMAMAAKWRHDTPVVMSEHGNYLRERYIAYLREDAPRAVKVLVLGFYRLLCVAGYLMADALAPHSSYNSRWQQRNGANPDRMWTMYNGVVPDEFPLPVRGPDTPTVVYMGRVDPLKDLHTLIQAFQLVREKVPRARLRIFGGVPAGNEEYAESCQRLIAELDLAGAVTMEGRVENPVEAYHAGWVVALTSISEGFPYTVVEAMACGRAVVCTDVGGVAEAVGDAGVVVPPRDVNAVADACVTLLRDHNRRHWLGEAARLRVIENFTAERWLDAYRRLYDGLRSGGSGREDTPQRPTLRARSDSTQWTLSEVTA